ncbi:unnamed protein product [Chilo suppressalis]|uniref:Ketosynthase family 3 (KS3) domain-containing protein n=1 Tax=Chilo suppressalis TaxID=168631 RepID=A0ABN8B3U2_CHISP|nr:unnamed protein product [Chilo suppressalis]
MSPSTGKRAGPTSESSGTSPEAVVISGVSGLLPDCDSYVEFMDKIFKNENLVKANPRWGDFKYPELPELYGRISGLDRFDAQFFTVFYTLAQAIDPTARKIIEHTYQAIFDSGINPKELWGKNIGVFVSYGYSETEKLTYTNDMQLAVLGSCKSMTANRISYWLNLKGPSIYMEGSSCGGLLALEKAREAIVGGICEAAIVGVGKLVLHPQTPISHRGMLNTDGITKCYDDAANGPSMSEAVNVFFLQKYKDANRAYVVLRHAKTQFMAIDEIISTEHCEIIQNKEQLTKFFHQFYEEAGVSPENVEYIEGYGAASPKIDKMELQAMENVFCKDRINPLLVGSVTSNLGYTESATGSCAIFKLLTAYQRGEIPATINCRNPRSDVASLHDGRMQIVTANTPFNRTSYTAVNGISYTGLNGHALLQSCFKPKDLTKYKSNIPYLVTVSGRHEAAVEKILDDIKDRPLDPEEIALLHNIHKNRISKHLARGVGIYSTKDNDTVTHYSRVEYHDDVSRPLWFVYSGMGSQWIGMARDLMRIPIFNQTIQRCHKFLEPKGIDLTHILTSSDKDIFNNILNSFIGITSVQIGLTDVLTAVGLKPDKMIGHSMGELGCAYADGCLTAEQTLLLAYHRGLVSTQMPFIRGSMAAVGMGHKNVSKICPAEIEVVCHNSANSSTISGPEKSVKDFVELLRKEGVFAKEVQCSNIAYHSRYIAGAGPEFLKLSQQVVTEPKLRSSKWLSSSVPMEQWDEPHAKYSSAEYHTNNLLNKVLFEEVLRHVPSNAVLVEIAPHGHMQAIMKQALSINCKHVSLTRRGERDGELFLLKSLGNLYMEGYDLDISVLYPRIEFPVSTETRSISHLVEWAHAEKWKVCEFLSTKRSLCSEMKLLVTVEDDEYKYLNGHCIDGLTVFPYAAALVAVWDTIAMTTGHKIREVSIRFTDVKFHSQPPIYDQRVLELAIMVARGNGRFEVIYDKGIIIEGYAVIIAGNVSINKYIDKEKEDPEKLLNKEDIYKIFYEQGFEYRDEFQSVQTLNFSMTQAQVQWKDNWVTFIAGILQACALRNISEQAGCEINFINKIIVDTKAHMSENINNKNSNSNIFTANFSELSKSVRCGGVSIENIFYRYRPLQIRRSVTLQSQKFQAFYQNNMNDIVLSVNVHLQVVAEYVNKNVLTLLVANLPNKRDLINKIKSAVEKQHNIKIKILLCTIEDILHTKTGNEKPDVIILHDLLKDKMVFEALYQSTAANTCLVSVAVETKGLYPVEIYKPISSYGSGKTKVELAVLKPKPKPPHITAVTVSTNTDIHQINYKCKNLTNQQKILALSPYPAPFGTKDAVKYWRENNKDLSLVMFDPKDSLSQELDNIPDVPICALQNGAWGNDYYLPTIFKSRLNDAFQLRISQPGDVNSLKWVGIQDPSEPGIEVTVQYAGLNMKDAKSAMVERPTVSADDGFGMDFSGYTASGDRVMGLTEGGAASSKVRARPELLWPVPSHWTMEDAATVPLPYAHAIYCMMIKFKLQKGMTVLVHGGAGGFGQAAISIALAFDCTVFTTVSDLRKKRFLKKLFPDLRDDHIGNSRDGSFADMIKKKLKKDSIDGGCDLICGFTKGHLKDLSLGCCGFSGHTIDISQLIEQEHFAFGLEHLFFCRTYSTSNFMSIFRENNLAEMRRIQLLMREGIQQGYIRPLTRVTYEPHETPRALRLLAGCRHYGRVLLSVPRDITIAKPRMSCTPDRNHLIVCDSDGFGLQVADILVYRGATRLYINCQETPYVKHKVRNWERKGIFVDVSSKTIMTQETVDEMLRKCSETGKIEGVYVVSTNPEQKHEAAAVITNLDSATRLVCPQLRYFAVISENDKLWKQIIVKRAKDSLPALSLQLVKLQRHNPRSITTDKSDNDLPWRYAVEAVEAALASGDAVVVAYAQPTTSHSILNEIAKIPGVNLTNATMGRTTLEQIGVDECRAQELCNVLQQKFNITISKEVVSAMTITQLGELQGQYIDIEQDLEGFAAYFSNFDSDVLQATCELVVMPTLVHRHKPRADEFDVGRDYLCVIPGLEGHYARFDTLCKRLKIPAAVLQPDHRDCTLKEIAQRIAKTIMQRLTVEKTFYLLGYDFGVLVAIEIASILESNGFTGTVFMLGGTPRDICNSFKSRFKDTTPELLQNALIKHIYTVITSNNNVEFENELASKKSWNDKVEILVKKLHYATEYTRALVQGVYARIKILQEFDFKPHALRSKLVLIRAKLTKLACTEVDSIENFPEVMKVHNIHAVLAHAHKDLACSNIINSHLNKDIIEAYENSNKCETFLENEEFIRLF